MSQSLKKISDHLYQLTDTCNVYLVTDGDRGLVIALRNPPGYLTIPESDDLADPRLGIATACGRPCLFFAEPEDGVLPGPRGLTSGGDANSPSAARRKPVR